MAAKKKRGPKQAALPTLDNSNKELDEAFDDYLTKKAAWMKGSEEVTEAKGVVVTLMVENNVTKYRYDGLVYEHIKKAKDEIKVHPAEKG